ncbi:MAG: heme ABC transporter ATP-binding protein [Cyclobacteriaceae bacterium]|nr:heme ABC transporter ATP-binding protein [Cyclobacteriaceae bacterium]
MYQAIDLSFRVRDRIILQNVNLTIRPGEFTAVVGPNGAGKSTLLKSLAYENTNFRGQVIINGTSTSSYTPKSLSRVRAVLPQSTTVPFAFTAEQIVHLGRYTHRSTHIVNRAIVQEVMERTSTFSLKDQAYSTLSGGEKQRVQLARVLAQVWEETVHPRYILLDEPTSSMDIAQQQQMFALAKSVCSRNIGVMAIVHDLNQAVQFADQLYFLRDGKITAAGEAKDVFTKTNIEETFCCRVNVYHDPCNNCPYVITERTDTVPASIHHLKLKTSSL